VSHGTYTPLSRPVFIYVKTQALTRPEVQTFVQFYLDKGQALVREVGYVPMTAKEVELVRARFTSRKTGTMFEGSDAHSQLTLEQRLAR
jgi:phosphate transport system substrate-binding protein